jgi:hypothetical protein
MKGARKMNLRNRCYCFKIECLSITDSATAAIVLWNTMFIDRWRSSSPHSSVIQGAL